MKPKHLLILAVILGLLVLGVVAKQFYKPREIVTEEYAPLDLSFDTGRVARLEIGKGKGEKLVELSKTDGRWRVTGFLNARADQDKTERFLKMVRGVKGELRGKDKSLFTDFGISEEQAYSILLSDDQGVALLKVLLGEKKPTYDSVFLRKADSEMVYYVDGNLFAQMGLFEDPAKEKPKGDYWASLNFADFDVDQVDRLDVIRSVKGKELVAAGIARESDKQWKYLRPDVPFAPDGEKIRQFLSSLKTWKAKNALDPAGKDFGFSDPDLQVKLGLAGGGEIVLTLGDVEEATQEHYARVSGEPLIFIIPDFNFKNMNIDDSQFFVDNPLELLPEKTEKVVIRADKKKVSLSPKKKKDNLAAGYLNDLKAFTVARLLFDGEEKKVQSPARFSLEIQKEGAPLQVLDVGEMISAEKKEYAAKMRHSPQAFAISEPIYKQIFDNLDRLK